MSQSPTPTLTPLSLALGSIVVAIIGFALKYWAYSLTNSIGLYSDALESLVNLAAALAVVVAIWLGEKPADHNHQFGHHKAEYLSAVLEGVLICLAAITIFAEAWQAYLTPRALDIIPLGLGLNGLAGLLNAGWATLLVRKGRELRSPALTADGKHLYSDVISSAGVLAGVFFAGLTGLFWLDPLLAIFVGVSILYTGWGLIKSSLGGLMDEAIDGEELDTIRRIILKSGAGAIEAHDLRTRHAGRVSFIEFHLVVPSALRVDEAHDICDQIEIALHDALPYSQVTIHIEPENKAHAPHSDGSMVF